MDKYIGRLLDNRYEILEVLGTGGMAVVYKARCHRLNRLVAIKILKDDYLQDEEFRRRFHSESQAVAMLSHPNIVSVYDVSTSITADYIVMELIDGITLKQYMEKKGVLNWKETLHFGIQIAKALEHAHERGIVHRDIKPHNVMVLKNGSVKVTDFGIARMMSKGNTLTKEALGSVHYISPEQAKGGRVDNRSDIYSLGVVMYEMMSGRPPYDGESPVSVAIQHINGGAVMPSTLNPNIPGGLEQIIMRAMAHDPSGRYSSAMQMLADMDEFRKDPAILFDYNVPPIDEVTKLPTPPAEPVAEEPRTTAEHVERKVAPPAAPRRRTTAAGSARQPARRKRGDEGKNNAATIAIIACSAVMVIAIVIFLVVLFSDGGSSKPVMAEVPSLVGQTYEENMTVDNGFSIILSREMYDDSVPAGQIIEQNPNAGIQTETGTPIYVVVSLGPAPQVVKMPNIAEWELSQAERALNNLDLGLQIQVEYEHNDSVGIDSVIRTQPTADVELTAGQKIIIYVSLGVEIKTSTMPDVTNIKLETALLTLNSQELGLVIDQVETYDSTVPVGYVIRTEPALGEDLRTGQTVTIYYSIGPELKVMPNVVGMSIGNAYSVLNTAGFAVQDIVVEYVTSNEDKDEVVEQSILPNSEVDMKNTQIILKVSQGSGNPVTKNVTIPLPENYDTDSVVVTDSNGARVAMVTVGESETEVTVTLTGLGQQTYTVVFTNEEEAVQRTIEVNFDE